MNLSIWAIVFVAAAIITIDSTQFNLLAPLLAVGMLLSTMVVRWAQKKR